MGLFDSYNDQQDNSRGGSRNTPVFAEPNNQTTSLFGRMNEPRPVVAIPRNGQIDDDLLHRLESHTEKKYGEVSASVGKSMTLHDFGEMGNILMEMTKVTKDLDVTTIQKNRGGLLAFVKRTYEDVKAEILSRTTTAEGAIKKGQEQIAKETAKMRQFLSVMDQAQVKIFETVADLKQQTPSYVAAAKILKEKIESAHGQMTAEQSVDIRRAQTQLQLVEELFRRHIMRIQQLELQAFDCQTCSDNSRKLVIHATSFMHVLPDILISVQQYAASLAQNKFAEQLTNIAAGFNSALVAGNKAVNDTALTVDTLLARPIVTAETMDTMRTAIANTAKQLTENQTTATAGREAMLAQQTAAQKELLSQIS
jgi:uncharacterized protein YaaN involved in tellurite resistance